MEGGSDALSMAYQNIKRGTPMVVVNNSGRMADAIAFTYTSSEPEDAGQDAIIKRQTHALPPIAFYSFAGLCIQLY